jgi:hypothetical protein
MTSNNIKRVAVVDIAKTRDNRLNLLSLKKHYYRTDTLISHGYFKRMTLGFLLSENSLIRELRL